MNWTMKKWFLLIHSLLGKFEIILRASARQKWNQNLTFLFFGSYKHFTNSFGPSSIPNILELVTILYRLYTIMDLFIEDEPIAIRLCQSMADSRLFLLPGRSKDHKKDWDPIKWQMEDTGACVMNQKFMCEDFITFIQYSHVWKCLPTTYLNHNTVLQYD